MARIGNLIHIMPFFSLLVLRLAMGESIRPPSSAWP